MTRPKSKSGSPPKTPKSNYKAFYSRAPNELLSECTTLTTVQDLENHRGDPHSYNFNAFCRTHYAHISVRPGRPGEPVCVDDRPRKGDPFSWAFVRGFQILCGFLGILPSVDVFLQFFEVKKQGKSFWVSFSGIAGRIILSLFQNSYKNWKENSLGCAAPSTTPQLWMASLCTGRNTPSCSGPRPWMSYPLLIGRYARPWLA